MNEIKNINGDELIANILEAYDLFEEKPEKFRKRVRQNIALEIAGLIAFDETINDLIVELGWKEEKAMEFYEQIGMSLGEISEKGQEETDDLCDEFQARYKKEKNEI